MAGKRKQGKRWSGKAWAYWMQGAKRWLTSHQPPYRGQVPILEDRLKGTSVDRENWIRVRVTITPLRPRRKS